MGFSGRKYTLPAPTESLIDSAVDEPGPASEDIATDVSKRTDRTSATIPDDGSPVTITTAQKKLPSKSSTPGNNSQTSLLIEFYEGADKTRRPSLRVRMRPSNKGGEATDGHIVVSQEGSRKPSYTQRIPLTAQSLKTHGQQEDIETGNGSDLHNARSAPIDIEIGSRGSQVSKMSRSPEPRYIVPGSDISSMPPDSMLGVGVPDVTFVPPATSSVTTKSDMPQSIISDMPESSGDLKPPVLPKERNLSHERITQKAIEKLSSRDRVTSKSSRHRSDRSRSHSSRGDVVGASAGERRRKSIKSYGEESTLSTGTDLSQVSQSNVSAGAKSAGSGTSNITNPRLLQTVEDAIRRLILPELIEIKRNGSRRQAYKDEDYSDVSENSITREKEQARRVSSGSKSKRRVSKESGSGSGSRRRHHRDYEYDSLSEVSSPRRDPESSSRSRGLVAGVAAGALTAAALHHQDSSSTLDQERERRRRRKRSKSRSSRGTSMNDSEAIFDKHDVPPMPFVSEVGSEMTRSSLLSSNTASTGTATQHDVRDVIRGSPLAGNMSGPHTPTRTSGDLRQSLGLHHKNISGHDLSTNRNSFMEQPDSPISPEEEETPETVREAPYVKSPLLADSDRMKYYEQNLHQQHPIRRGLSPIQSVASYATTEPARNSMMHSRSVDSIGSIKRRQQALKEEMSTDSFSSASPGLKKQNRPQGINLENPSEIMHQHDSTFGIPRGTDFYDDDDLDDEDDEYSQDGELRDSYATNDGQKLDPTSYLNQGEDTPLDKVGDGRHIARGIAAIPEYVHTPPGVESAVASLIEPSILDLPNSPQQSVRDSIHSKTSLHSAPYRVGVAKPDSPLKSQMHLQSHESLDKTRQLLESPPQSPAVSYLEDRSDHLQVPPPEKTTPSPESEITTNPSVIQGPIVGLSGSGRDPWTYAPTSDRAVPNFPAQQVLNKDLGMITPDLVPQALNVSQRNTFNQKADMYDNGVIIPPSPGVKDEGYQTGDRSPGLHGKQNQRAMTPPDLDISEDPFVDKRRNYTSGLSQGMSPLYDAATGRGIDRIQSKDIVALMDHLTVRDAQRNARDTEILVTLVRSAAEMRNQFEDMKKFISEQDELILNTGDRQHEKTQRIIGGPRPQPASRAALRSATSQDDTPAKRRNIFARAVQRLGSKNENELQNIERMLVQLLQDVETLRMGQDEQHPLSSLPQQSQQMMSTSLASAENARAMTDPGYEPEGQAGTSSTGDRSGLLSGSSSRQADYRVTSGHKEQPNRISTVMEGDEEYEGYEDQEDDEDAATPRASPSAEARYRHSRGQSAPTVETPPKLNSRLSQPWGNENTPQHAYEPPSTGKKHKSIASSFFGKGGLMSRWSKTTASTMPDTRQSVSKGRPYSQVSRSGSDLAAYHYDPQPEDQLRSMTIQNDGYQDGDDRPPSPLVPSQVSENPKYQGYRNSQNLQHPQPRQGPTGRYQYHLESEAITYDDQFSPTSQASSQHWETTATITNANDFTQYAPQPPLSPISDTAYSESSLRSSRRASARQSKEADNDPLIPQRSYKISMSPNTYVDHVAAARAGSPAHGKSPVAALRSSQGSQTQRKPSGPRPLSSAGPSSTTKPVKGDFSSVKRTRFRGSPYQIDSEEDLTRQVA